MSGANAESTLRLILRIIGTSSLFGAAFVVAPRRLMEAIHADLGMGAMPEGPVVGYLARSTSAFYAILGGLFWVISFDLRRHRAVLLYLGAAVTVFGVALFIIDWQEGLPLFWKLWEGPFVTVIGLALFSLGRHVPRPQG